MLLQCSWLLLLLLLLWLSMLLLQHSSRHHSSIPVATGRRQAGLWQHVLKGLLLGPTHAASCCQRPPTTTTTV
jgi:hypothetical protein